MNHLTLKPNPTDINIENSHVFKSPNLASYFRKLSRLNYKRRMNKISAFGSVEHDTKMLSKVIDFAFRNEQQLLISFKSIGNMTRTSMTLNESQIKFAA